MIEKLNTGDIYDGCLKELKDELTSILPETQGWTTTNGIKDIIGNKNSSDAYNTPFMSPPAYFQIYFGEHYIQPVSYSLMGRRISEKQSFLKSWDFFGLTQSNKWKLLSSYKDWEFGFGEVRTFLLQAQESYKGFMINMTELNSYNEWALCLGQIEVHGYIFDSPTIYHIKPTCSYSFKFPLLLPSYLFVLLF